MHTRRRRRSRRNGAQVRVDGIQVPIRHEPKLRPRHDGQDALIDWVVTGANRKFKLFEGQACRLSARIGGDVGRGHCLAGRAKIHTAGQVPDVIELPVAIVAKRRRKRIMSRFVRRAGMAIGTARLGVHDVAA